VKFIAKRSLEALRSADDSLRLIVETLSEVKPRMSVWPAMNTAQAERKRISKVMAGIRAVLAVDDRADQRSGKTNHLRVKRTAKQAKP